MAIANWQIASLVPYSNTVSGLAATQVQAAIDEIVSTLTGSYVKQNGNSFGATLTIGTNDDFDFAFETHNVARATFLKSGEFYVGTTTVPASLGYTDPQVAMLNYKGLSTIDSAHQYGYVIASMFNVMEHDDSRDYEFAYVMYNYFHVPSSSAGFINDSIVMSNNKLVNESTSWTCPTVVVLNNEISSAGLIQFGTCGNFTSTGGSSDTARVQNSTGINLYVTTASVGAADNDPTDYSAVGVYIVGVSAYGSSSNNNAYGIWITNSINNRGSGDRYAIYSQSTADSYLEGLTTFKSGVKVKNTGAGSTTLDHYQEVAETDLGTLTWTAGVAPSGTITKKYKATRVGNRVDLWCRIEASVAGTAVTAVSFPLPSDTGISSPGSFSGFGNSEFDIVGAGSLTVAGAINTNGPNVSFLGKTGGGTWTVYIAGPSLAADTAFCHITYFI